MTKHEIERRIQEHNSALKKLYEQLENACDELTLDNYEKPFRKWSLAEQAALNDLNSAAYDWFYSGNTDKTILDYNASVPRLERVPLAQEVY